jgi:hypothetical protein
VTGQSEAPEAEASNGVPLGGTLVPVLTRITYQLAPGQSGAPEAGASNGVPLVGIPTAEDLLGDLGL